MGKADLHIHSTISDGMASVSEVMAYAEECTELDVIAIADHDAVDGALESLEWVDCHPDCRIRSVFATEVTAELGRHLLGYFFRPPYPSEPLPQLRSYRHTIDLIHEMGGIAAIPHPTVIWTPSGGYRHILSLIGAGVRIDGIEVCNAAIGARGSERKVRLFNERDFHLSEMGGSDAHHLSQIGSACTLFQGHTPRELEQALLSSSTRAAWGKAVSVSWKDHARQLFKSWVEKPTRGVRATFADR